jgi:hypothetical protein
VVGTGCLAAPLRNAGAAWAMTNCRWCR